MASLEEREGALMSVILERFSYSPFGTFGTLTYGGKSLVTVEKPADGNKPYVSCIPPGVYTCKRYKSERFPNTFQIMGVPGRTHILFHVGNTSKDVEGCIALGQYLDDEGWGIKNSRFAFREFMDDMQGRDCFELQITEKTFY